MLEDNLVEQQGLKPLIQSVFTEHRTVRFEIEYDTSRVRGLHLAKQSKVILDVTISPICDADGVLTNAVIQHIDITERKQSEQALRESEASLASIFRAAPVGIGLASDRVFKRVNDRLCAMLGYSREELLEKNARMIYPSDEDFEFVGREKYAQIRAKGTGTVETRFRCKNGNIINVLLSSTPLDPHNAGAGTTFTALDITDRVRTERALRESEQRMELALQGAGLGTWDWNVQTGEVLFNKRWAEMLGYTLDELEPRLNTWEKLVHPDDMPYIERVLHAHLEGRTNSYETEHRLKHKSGRWIWVLDEGKVIERDATGKPLRACGTHLDITERKRTERLAGLQSDLAHTLSRTIDLNGALSYCLSAAMAATEMDAGGVYVIDKKTGCLDLAVSHGLSEDFLAGVSHFAADSPNARVVMKGKPVYTVHQRLYNGINESRLKESLRAIGVIPVSHEGKVIACLNIASHASDDFPEPTRRVAEAIANQIGGVIARIQAEQALRQAHDELELRVKERTQELLQTNQDLNREILVRNKIEKKLRDHQQKLQTLASELSLAEERERRRFAENLHDTISQSLVMAHMKLESLAIDKLPPETTSSIRQINQMVGQALENTQMLTFELSPQVLYRLGLGPAIESLADQLHRLHGLKVELVDNGPKCSLPENIAVLLFRAVRELLINVIKHAKTKTAKVTIADGSGGITVQIEDTGVGFDTGSLNGRHQRERFGLFNIQERLTHLGGMFNLVSEPGKGTRITMVAPLVNTGSIIEGKHI